MNWAVQDTLEPVMDLEDAVRLPAAVDSNDWLAVHVVGFFNRINALYETVRQLNPIATGLAPVVCDKVTKLLRVHIVS